MKERIKGFICTWVPILASFLMVLAFTGIHTFIYQHNYDGYDSAWIFLIPMLVAMAVTLFLFHYCKKYLAQLTDVEIPYLLVGVVLAVGVFLMLVTAEVRTGVVSVSDSRILYLVLFKIEKKWLFDLYVILVFPTFVTSIMKGLTRNDTTANRVSAAAAIALLNTASVLFFSQMSAIYLVEMAVLNFFTVVLAVIFWDWEKMESVFGCDDDEDSSAWDEDYEDENNLSWVEVVFFYCIFWIFLLLCTKSPGESFTEYMYSGNWNLYKQNISGLVECTGTWGAACGPENMYTIRQFLVENNNVIHSLLYYTGWGGLAVYGVLLVGFVTLMFRFLGGRYSLYKPYYLIYQAAFLNLLIRAVCGILYGFGILPIPVSLPFGGSVALIMDGVCVALLLYSEIFENMAIRRTRKRDGEDVWDDEFDEEDLLWKKDEEES